MPQLRKFLTVTVNSRPVLENRIALHAKLVWFTTKFKTYRLWANYKRKPDSTLGQKWEPSNKTKMAVLVSKTFEIFQQANVVAPRIWGGLDLATSVTTMSLDGWGVECWTDNTEISRLNPIGGMFLLLENFYANIANFAYILRKNSIENATLPICTRGWCTVHVILNFPYYFTMPAFKITLLSSILILLCDDVISVIIHDLIVVVHHDAHIVHGASGPTCCKHWKDIWASIVIGL